MGEISQFTPHKLILGCLFSSSKNFEEVLRELCNEFGDIDFRSRDIPFTFTTYYEKEMGAELFRCFVSFKQLIDP